MTFGDAPSLDVTAGDLADLAQSAIVGTVEGAADVELCCFCRGLGSREDGRIGAVDSGSLVKRRNHDDQQIFLFAADRAVSSSLVLDLAQVSDGFAKPCGARLAAIDRLI